MARPAAAAEKARARDPELPVVVSVPQEVLICPMDALLIEQVLLNLLQNAAQHAAGATAVTILVSKDRQHVKIDVQDDGAGMRKEQLNIYRKTKTEVLNMFDDSARTAGIGLSVCGAIVAAHGGSLLLENRDNGFSAALLLPLGEQT